MPGTGLLISSLLSPTNGEELDLRRSIMGWEEDIWTCTHCSAPTSSMKPYALFLWLLSVETADLKAVLYTQPCQFLNPHKPPF